MLFHAGNPESNQFRMLLSVNSLTKQQTIYGIESYVAIHSRLPKCCSCSGRVSNVANATGKRAQLQLCSSLYWSAADLCAFCSRHGDIDGALVFLLQVKRHERFISAAQEASNRWLCLLASDWPFGLFDAILCSIFDWLLAFSLIVSDFFENVRLFLSEAIILINYCLGMFDWQIASFSYYSRTTDNCQIRNFQSSSIECRPTKALRR